MHMFPLHREDYLFLLYFIYPHIKAALVFINAVLFVKSEAGPVSQWSHVRVNIWVSFARWFRGYVGVHEYEESQTQTQTLRL